MDDKPTLSLPNPISSVDIAIRLNRIPRADELTSTKQYMLNLDHNGLRLVVRLKGKSWRKALSTVEEIEKNGGQWSMMISGKAGKMTGKAIEIESAGVQIFEKKPKSATDSSSATETD